ncbi:MAG: cytochrome c oxidase subunit 3 family protein [Denitromonas halophila]|nr:MAG: cytochrome c oxidase subunit 3 family protein [Denitromonas halophila]
MNSVVGGGRRTKGRIPGEIGIWLFVMGDLMVFSVFFILIAIGQKEHAALFNASRAQFDMWVGVFNTFLLLTGSWFVAIGVARCRAGLSAGGARNFTLGILCGVGFVANKAVEWGGKISDGLSPATNDFYMFFFVFTGIHLLHVLVGLVVLFVVRSASCRPTIGVRELRTIESGAVFWHLVDLLWVVLFALLYLL